MRVQELIEQALALSTADGCVVVAAEHTETNLRWAANNLTTNGQMTSRSITVISAAHQEAGTSAGVVTRTVSDVDELTALVRASERAAREADPAEDAAELIGSDAGQHRDAGRAHWDADPRATTAEVFAEFAPALGRAFAAAAGRDERLYGFAEHQLTSQFVASSTGLRCRFDQPNGRVELNGKSTGHGGAGSVWAGLHTNDFADVDVEALADSLHTRLEWSRTRIDLPAGRYEAILPPTAVADLMIYAYWAASARDAEEGRSVFSGPDGTTRVGQRLSPLPLTLRSDPSYPGLQCPPFEIVTASEGGLQSVFDNGLPVAPADWIRDGVLRELVRTRAWAARSGAAPRPFVSNLILSGEPGNDSAGKDVEDLIAGTERALLLTCLWYIRVVDPQTFLLTGLTRDGVFLVEDGQVRGAVNNFRFNESPIDLLSRVTEVGRTQPTLPREWADYFTRAAMPPLRVADFNMSTVSQAS